jgi:trans-aconitate methyltransferase
MTVRSRGTSSSASAFDISDEMVRTARNANTGIENVSFVVNHAGDLSRFPDPSLDLVYSRRVLQHVPDWSAVESYVCESAASCARGRLATFGLPSHIPAIFRLQWRRRLYVGLRRFGASPEFLYRARTFCRSP